MGLPTSPRPPSGPPDPFRTFEWASRTFRLGLPDLTLGFSTLSSPSSCLADHSRTSGWATRPLPNLQVGLSTLPRTPCETLDPSLTSGGPTDPYRTYGWVSKSLLDFWVGLLIPT